MRTARSSVVACLVAVAAVLLPAGSADAAGGSEVPQVPGLELYGIEHTAVAINFSSCRRLPARHVQIHENARAVFREMKRGADYGASFRARTTHQRARRAARMAPALSSHSEARAHARGDRVQFRAKVNGRVRYACYRVSPDGHRATYSRSGRPGTWRLGRCR